MQKICAILLVIILVSESSEAQTFSDCSNDYHDHYNRIMLQRIQKKISDRVADSLSNVISLKFDQCIIGKEFTDFTLVGRNGKTHSNDSLLGKVVLLNFWALFCGPCLAEIPVFNRVYGAYKENKDFIIISILWDREEDLEKLLNKVEVDYEIAPNAKVMMKSGIFKFVKSFPTNIFLDKEGKVFLKTTGGLSDPNDEPVLESKLKSIIDGELNK
jgi:thiol-disulfide isomerase/thioredoxin